MGDLVRIELHQFVFPEIPGGPEDFICGIGLQRKNHLIRTAGGEVVSLMTVRIAQPEGLGFAGFQGYGQLFFRRLQPVQFRVVRRGEFMHTRFLQVQQQGIDGSGADRRGAGVFGFPQAGFCRITNDVQGFRSLPDNQFGHLLFLEGEKGFLHEAERFFRQGFHQAMGNCNNISGLFALRVKRTFVGGFTDFERPGLFGNLRFQMEDGPRLIQPVSGEIARLFRQEVFDAFHTDAVEEVGDFIGVSPGGDRRRNFPDVAFFRQAVGLAVELQIHRGDLARHKIQQGFTPQTVHRLVQLVFIENSQEDPWFAFHLQEGGMADGVGVAHF